MQHYDDDMFGDMKLFVICTMYEEKIMTTAEVCNHFSGHGKWKQNTQPKLYFTYTGLLYNFYNLGRCTQMYTTLHIYM